MSNPSQDKRKKAQHGGARPGAGRPKTGDGDLQKIIFYLDSETHQRLKQRALDEGKHQSVLIRSILRRSLGRSASSSEPSS